MNSLSSLVAVAALFLAAAFAAPQIPQSPEGLTGQSLVDWINAQGKWKAEYNPVFADKSKVQAMLGSKTKTHPNAELEARKRNQKPLQQTRDPIPAEFDARTNWPECTDVISKIADQSACGSCWAVSAASVMTDRVCINSGGADKTPISAIEATSCSGLWWDGCSGGWEYLAFDLWEDEGIVSGSSYKEDSGCKPYPFAECEHHFNGTTSYPPCPVETYEAGDCTTKCQTGYSTPYQSDKKFGHSVKFFSSEEQIQREVMENGPVTVAFTVYEDFLWYKSGIYQHLAGSMHGGHAVRLLGWGEENGTKFWIIANNWNDEWAENGIIRFIRGIDDCGIDTDATSALAK